MNWKLIPEPQLSPSLEADIQQMLIASFPDYVDFFSANSYWGTKPEFRLIAVDAGQPIAHVEFGYREITIEDSPVEIAGIGAVAIHPDHQGKKLGKALFAHLRGYLLENSNVDFGFLGCHEQVVGFYAASGFQQVKQCVYNLNPDSQEWETYHGPTMVLPVHKPMQEWKSEGMIHLHGMPW